MNNYLLVSLGLFLLLFIVGQAIEVSSISLIPSTTYEFDEVTGEPISINGSSTEVGFAGYNLVLGISLTEGIMITSIALGALIILIGINIATWSLSDIAQRSIINFTVFGGIWAIFSVTIYDLIMIIDLLGWMIFFIISFIHFMGILKEVNASGT